MIRKAGFVLIVLSTLFALAPPLRAEDGATAAKLENLMKASGYKSAAKVKDAVWTIDFTGKQLPRFKVVVTATDKDKSGIIVALVNPVAKDQLPRNRAALTGAILKANNDFDYVKVAFDKDGDLFVRADMPPGMDVNSFKTVVEQVAAAADEFCGRIKPLLR